MSQQTYPSDKWLLDLDSRNGTVFMQIVPGDSYWYERKEHALKGNYDVEELSDNPDFDVRIDMDWSDIYENGDNNG